MIGIVLVVGTFCHNFILVNKHCSLELLFAAALVDVHNIKHYHRGSARNLNRDRFINVLQFVYIQSDKRSIDSDLYICTQNGLFYPKIGAKYIMVSIFVIIFF